MRRREVCRSSHMPMTDTTLATPVVWASNTINAYTSRVMKILFGSSL